MASGDVNSTFGALLIGLLFAAFLFGTLTLQTYLYFRKFWRDPVLLKVVVMALWSLNTLQMCFISSAQYKYVVTNFLGLLSDNSQAWTETIHLTVTAVITFIVQCFFVTRLWFLSGKSVLLIIGIIPLMVARLAIGITTTAITIRIGNYNSADPERGWMIACLASPLPMNVFITATLAYFVHRRRPKINLKNTLTLLDTFVLYSLHTALLPCIISVASLICYVSMENSLVFVAVHYILGELYTSCMLVVLNARKSSQGRGTYIAPADTFPPDNYKHSRTFIRVAGRSQISGITDSTQSSHRPLKHITTDSVASLEFRGIRERSPGTPIHHVAPNPDIEIEKETSGSDSGSTLVPSLSVCFSVGAVVSSGSGGCPEPPPAALGTLAPLEEESPPPTSHSLHSGASESTRSHLTGPSITWESVSSRSMERPARDLGDIEWDGDTLRWQPG